LGSARTPPARVSNPVQIQNGGLAVRDLTNFVGGQETDFAYDRRSEVIDPSTGEAFATAPISREAFEGWRDTTPAERSLALLRIADTLEEKAEQLVAAESQNTGKPVALTL